MSLASSLCGSEPIAGYRVTERLGAGGYGEVWKVEAPGGLQKAIKFIYGYLSDDKATRELKALNRIKQIRHPFLLSLERIEVLDGQLIIVTELADLSLKDRFQACQAAGMPAIPRDELLGYLRDAADALDFLSANALQHLDVKPENLLLVGGRVKVADFGLVKEIKDHTCSMMGGMTPVYASPETFDGRPDVHSDQYSLAIVYQEMLTGTLPFPGNTTAQLASQHLYSRPRLESLPENDRPIIAKALEKKPNERFANSRALVDALLTAGTHCWRGLATTPESAHGPTASSGVQGRPAEEFPSRRPSARSRDAETTFETPPPRSSTSTAAPQQNERAAVVNLPPLEASPDVGLRPTLFLGIGGMAGHILTSLRRRLTEQFGSPTDLPLFQTLLVDTDASALSSYARGPNGSPFAAAETLALTLRKPQEYRTESLDILQWLSRRWLYNIPRSLQTEGMRPLGRLALVDHVDEFFNAVRRSLLRATSDDAVATAEQKMGVPLRDRSPRIFVVASVSGGTGGGMVLDVGYALRTLLAEMKLADDGLCGILTHCTNRLASGKDLAIANTYACLSELDHYCQDRYPGEPSCSLPAFDRGQSPFPHTYFLHLGNELGDNEYKQAADAVAEYLFLDAATAGGAFLDQCRAEDATIAVAEPTKLRTFGVCRVGCQQEVLETATDALVKSLVGNWTGELRRRSDQGSLDSHLDPLIDEMLSEHALRASSLVKRFQADIQQTLQSSPQAALQSLAARLLAEEPAAETSKPLVSRWERLTARAMQSLGMAEAEDHPGPLACLPRAVDSSLARASQDLGLRLEEFCKAVTNQSGLRLACGHLACEKLMYRLRELETELAAEEQRLAAQLARPPLESRGAVPKSRWSVLSGKADALAEVPSPADQLVAYGRLMLEQMALKGAHRLVRALLARLSSTGDSFVALGRELRRIGDAIQVGEAWSDAFLASPDQSKAQDVERAVLRELRGRFSNLVTQFEKHIDEDLLNSHGGLTGLVHCSSGELQTMSTLLKSAARRELVQVLKEIDVARIVLGPLTEAAASQESLKQFTRLAWPKALECGGAKRLLLVVPESPTTGPIPDMLGGDTQENPTVLVSAGCDVVACYEAERVPLAKVAAALVCDDPQFADIAYRLHTRTDVEWRPL